MESDVKVAFGGIDEGGGNIRGEMSIPRRSTVGGISFARESNQ